MSVGDKELETNHTHSSNGLNRQSLFQNLVVIEPLGFLYGSSGRFLSPENLVGRSGSSFPPSAASLSGLFAAAYAQDEPNKKQLADKLKPLYFAGPFWARNDSPQNFYVPTPFNCLVNKGEDCIAYQLIWNGEKWLNQKGETPTGKFENGTWIKIKDWNDPNWIGKNVWMNETDDRQSLPVSDRTPWKFAPHLHPRMDEEQRRVSKETERQRGSLFLENGVQLDPDYCLVYLTNAEINPGWYRFGGEGHIIDVRCLQLDESTKNLLTQDVGKSFALITPAIWGSNRLSTRFPLMWDEKNHYVETLFTCMDNDEVSREVVDKKNHYLETLLTERPSPFRYRLGGEGQIKRLSRGRYAVPAGTIYVMKTPLKASWQEWDVNWFPKEGPSLKRWGCGLSLPLPSAIKPS